MPITFPGATGIGPDHGSPSMPPSVDQLLTTGTTPQVLASIIKSLGLDNPLGTGQPDQRLSADTLASGKSLTDLLGEIFYAPGNAKFGKLRLTSVNPSPDASSATFHNIKTGQPMEATLPQANQLYRSGQIMREGPPTEGMSIESLVNRLRQVLAE